MGLLVTFCLGIFFIIGALITRFSKNKKTIENLSISISFGTMGTLIVLELVPEMFEHLDGVDIIYVILLVLSGVGLLKILDLFIPEHDHEHGLDHDCTNENLLHIGIVSLVAIVLHNIIEGIAVYSLATESVKTGLLVGLGVGLHNIPMGMVISSTLEYESKRKKVIALLLSFLSTFVGGLIMFFLNSYINEFIIGILIAITLGMIIYIELFELIPHIRHSKNKKLSILGIIIGIIIIILSTLFE